MIVLGGHAIELPKALQVIKRTILSSKNDYKRVRVRWPPIERFLFFIKLHANLFQLLQPNSCLGFQKFRKTMQLVMINDIQSSKEVQSNHDNWHSTVDSFLSEVP